MHAGRDTAARSGGSTPFLEYHVIVTVVGYVSDSEEARWTPRGAGEPCPLSHPHALQIPTQLFSEAGAGSKKATGPLFSWRSDDGLMTPVLQPRSKVTAIVYAEDPGLLRPIMMRLDASETEAVSSRRAFEARIRFICQGVVGVGEASSDTAAWLSRTAAMGIFLVVVSRLTPDNARRLGPVQCDRIRILWLEELKETIRLPMNGVPPDPLRVFAESVSSRRDVCPMIRQALQLICCSEVPPHSVQAVSARLGVAPTTFRYHWYVGLGHGLPPKELIQWATLVRAIELRSQEKWVSVAYRLGVHRRTLERLCHRLTGSSLGSLASDPPVVASLFRQRTDAAFSST